MIDPSPLPKNRTLDATEFDAAVAKHVSEHQLTDEVLAERSDRLAWVVTRPLEASVSYLPAWPCAAGGRAVWSLTRPTFPRSPVRMYARKASSPASKRKVLGHSADPDAGLYIRTDGDPTAGPKAKGTKKIIKSIWAYEASLIVTAAERPAPATSTPTS